MKKHLDAVFGAHRGSFKYDDIDHLIDDLPLFIKEDFEEIKGDEKYLYEFHLNPKILSYILEEEGKSKEEYQEFSRLFKL